MTLGAGVAVVGIWIGVGIVGNRDAGYGVGAALFAAFATWAVAVHGG